MVNIHDQKRNQFMLNGKYKKQGYDWWWHSFTATNEATGEEKPFFIEYFCCNPGLSPDKVVLGQDPENKKNGIKPSYVMMKCGTWGEDAVQVHNFYPWKDVKVQTGAPFKIEFGECMCCEDRMFGKASMTKEEAEAHPEYMCEWGDFEWDLKLNKVDTWNVGFGAGGFFRTLKAFEMFWHAEGVKTKLDGYVIFNGQKYIVTPETSNGYQDKNWGKDFTTPWVWLSSWDMTSKITGKKLENSVFDIGGGRPKCGPIVLERKLLGEFYYEGKSYEFNFSKFWTGSKTEFDCYETETQIVWHVDQKTRKARLVTDITCEKKDMLFVKYEAPNGKKLHNRLWNGGNGKGTLKLYGKDGELIDEIEVKRIGCEYGEYCEEGYVPEIREQ